jgi:serine protease inhibitor ecotin
MDIITIIVAAACVGLLLHLSFKAEKEYQKSRHNKNIPDSDPYIYIAPKITTTHPKEDVITYPKEDVVVTVQNDCNYTPIVVDVETPSNSAYDFDRKLFDQIFTPEASSKAPESKSEKKARHTEDFKAFVKANTTYKGMSNFMVIRIRGRGQMIGCVNKLNEDSFIYNTGTIENGDQMHFREEFVVYYEDVITYGKYHVAGSTMLMS